MVGTADPLGGGASGRDDPFDTLASWPALANFVDDIGEQMDPQEPQGMSSADSLLAINNLQRSLSLPAYLNNQVGNLGGIAPLSRGLRAGSFGPLIGGGQQLDANSEISARLVNMLSKVCKHPSTKKQHA